MKISVVVPVFVFDEDLVEKTHQCLRSLKTSTMHTYEIIIIDNNSKVPFPYKSYADIYIYSSINKGNAVAWNMGAALSHGEIIVFMDNDVIVGEGWDAAIVEELERNITTGVAFPEVRATGQESYTADLAGFCWAVRRDTWERVGPVSEKYGLAYYEDTDYFMRVQEKKYKLKCARGSKAFHYARSTTDKMAGMEELKKTNKELYEKTWKVYPSLD